MGPIFRTADADLQSKECEVIGEADFVIAHPERYNAAVATVTRQRAAVMEAEDTGVRVRCVSALRFSLDGLDPEDVAYLAANAHARAPIGNPNPNFRALTNLQ